LLRNIFSVKNIIIIAVNALCLIAFFICLLVSASIKAPLRSQQAAIAWAGQSGERFAQLSVFLPESFGFGIERVYQARSSIDRALLTVSLESTPGRILYTDAWSTETSVIVTSERETNPVTVNAIAVGGDFFLFHPLYLRDGSYLSPDDLMKDRVLIDEALAWRLFGAARVAGFEISVNEKIFIVAGVISRESDFASSGANTEEFGLFMSFDALLAMKEGNAEISTYEVVMPDPITGFALASLSEAISDKRAVIVENSTRFSLRNSFAIVGSFGENSMRSNAVAFPYWENAARIVEDWLALLLVLSLVFIIFPIICAVIYTVKLIRFGVWCGKDLVRKVIDEKDKRHYDKYMAKYNSEPQIHENEVTTYDVYDADEIINYDIYDDADNIINYNIYEDADDNVEYSAYGEAAESADNGNSISTDKKDMIESINNDVNDIANYSSEHDSND